MPSSSREVAYDVAPRRLDSQLSRVDVIDSKIITVLGIAGASLGIFAGFLAVVVDAGKVASVTFAFASGSVVLGVYVAAMVFGLRGSAIGKWDQRPNWDELIENSASLDLATMHAWVAETCVVSLNENEPQLVRKADDGAWTTRLALLDAILVAFALLGLLVINAAF